MGPSFAGVVKTEDVRWLERRLSVSGTCERLASVLDLGPSYLRSFRLGRDVVLGGVPPEHVENISTRARRFEVLIKVFPSHDPRTD